MGVFLEEVLLAEYEMFHPPEKVNLGHSPFEQHSWTPMSWCKRGISYLYAA